jgi:uncharacterized protein YegP (UPF0339 family)
MAAKFEVTQTKPGEFRWVLTSQGRTLATSPTYTRKVSCVKAIESLRKAATDAPVDDTTVKPAAAKAAAPAKATPAKAAAKPAKAIAKTAKTAAKAAAKTAKTAAKTPSPRKRAAKS